MSVDKPSPAQEANTMVTETDRKIYADINHAGDTYITVTLSGEGVHDLTEPQIEAALSTDADPVKTPLENDAVWARFYRDGKTLGEICEEFKCGIYDLSPWLTAPLIRSALSAQVQDVAGERWIDVNDKLPGEQGQDSEEVSVFLNGHCGLLDHDKRKGGGWGYRTGFYDADIGCFRVHGRPDRFVTHWMPLPASPASKHGDAE